MGAREATRVEALRRTGAVAIAIATAIAAVAASGCGYHFANSPRLPAEGRSVHVPVFRNLTAEGGVEAWFTEALRGQFARAGLEGGEASDLVAEGEIVEVSLPIPAVYNLPANAAAGSSAQIALYRVRGTAVVKLLRAGKVVGQTRVVGEEEYQPGFRHPPSPEELPYLSESEKRLALRRLAETLMRRAFQNLTTLQ